ncbi:MAG: hypothetical protein WED34_04295 [Planctomycetales bacterium]
MKLPSNFTTASEAMERCAGLLADAYHCSKRGEWAAAYGYLAEAHRLWGQSEEAVHAARDALAGAADQVLQRYGWTGQRAYPSAHEMVSDLCLMAYVVLMLPLVGIEDADEWEATAGRLLAERTDGLYLPPTIRAAITRERGKLLASSGTAGSLPAPSIETGGKKKMPATNRKKNINMRMLEKITLDVKDGNQECFSWTLKQWAEFLGCKYQSVAATYAWKTVLKGERERMKGEREQMRAERAMKQQRGEV